MKDYEWRLKYDPNQPRVPAGQPGGGRWTSEGGISAGSTIDEIGTRLGDEIPDLKIRQGDGVIHLSSPDPEQRYGGQVDSVSRWAERNGFNRVTGVEAQELRTRLSPRFGSPRAYDRENIRLLVHYDARGRFYGNIREKGK